MVDGELWYSFPAYCRRNFGKRLYRVALDAGMTCPNRDGTVGRGGCVFCDEGGSGDFAVRYYGQQLREEDLPYNHSHSGAGSYIAYFQAYTNTYAPVEKLRTLFRAALSDPLFAGISIATRPDCLGKDVLRLLEELKMEFPDRFIWVELGLQSMHDRTAAWIRRGYPLRVFDQACMDLEKLGIPIIVHVILGLPSETDEMVLDTIRHLNRAGISGIKIQLLQYLKGTDLCRMYESGADGLCAMKEEEYVSLAARCLGMLDENVAVHRVTGDGDRNLLAAPLWALNKKKVINEIRHYMAAHQIRQGCYWKEEKMSSAAMKVREMFAKGDKERDAGNTTPDDIQRFDNLVYGSDEKWQVLDVYRPKKEKGPLPVIVSFHGGGWVYGDKDVYQWYTMNLAQRGFAVINFTYRLAPEFAFPAPLEDCSLVIKWMAAHAQEYGLDMNNVFAVGDSAGAHGLSLFCSIVSDPSYAQEYGFDLPEGFQFNAVALNCGAYRITLGGKEDLTTMLMADYLPEGGSEKELHLISCAEHITSAFPPCFIMTCDGDFLKEQVKEIVPVLLKENVAFTLRYFGGNREPLPHVFHCNIKLAEAALCNDEECAFFREHIR